MTCTRESIFIFIYTLEDLNPHSGFKLQVRYQ